MRGSCEARRICAISQPRLRDTVARESGVSPMVDTDSRMDWHRVQLRKKRAALKALGGARFTAGHDRIGETQKAIEALSRKITESEKCISAHQNETRRPLGTDFGSLTKVSWGHWNAHTNGQR